MPNKVWVLKTFSGAWVNYGDGRWRDLGTLSGDQLTEAVVRLGNKVLRDTCASLRNAIRVFDGKLERPRF